MCRKAKRPWTFNKRTGTVFYRLRSPKKRIFEVLQAYMECGSVDGVARTFGRNISTITRWTDRAALHCESVNQSMICDIESMCVQLDELWSYCQKKENEQWIWNAIDAMTKLLIAFVVGPWTKKSAKKLVKRLKKRIKAVWLFLSDGLDHYIKPISKKFKNATYIQMVKHYKGKKLESLEIRHIQGLPVAVAEELIRLHGIGSGINTAFVERLNLTERQSCSKLKRKTLCYAKLVKRLVGFMNLFQAYYNFVRPHESLEENGVRRTPAMATRLTDHAWTWSELLSR
jgi:IS1 family transposase